VAPRRVKIQPMREVPQSPPIPRGRKTTLSKKELADFREMLVAKRRSLLGDLSGMAEQTTRDGDSGNLSTMPTHMADVGTDNFEHEFTLGLLESEQALLREINEALQRIDDRTYGICLGTGEPIPKARLKAKPWAKYTVDYARMLEKGLVRAPDGRDDDDRAEGEDEVDDEIEEEEVDDVVGEEAEAGEAEVHEDDEE
jgi:DnaK suppressor protein